MSVNFSESETVKNLMRAFAGESQARNRYTFAADKAKSKSLYVIEALFKFTADQEKAHAEVFYNHLSELNGKTIDIDGGYPVNTSESVVELLKSAEHNEREEHDIVYQRFADVADKEGFARVAHSFRSIAEVEGMHGERFAMFADMLEKNKLFVSEVERKWICLNCGHILTGKEVPEVCPVCSHNKGYFVRIGLAPFTN